MKAGKIVLVLFLTVCFSCEKETDLKGTKWKLVGRVSKSGELQVFRPIDCEDCYTLTFESDFIASAHSIIHDIRLDLKHLNYNPKILWPTVLELERYEKDGELYAGGYWFRFDILHAVSFKSSALEFKLFLYKKDYYLLFKRISL